MKGKERERRQEGGREREKEACEVPAAGWTSTPRHGETTDMF